MKKSDMMYLLGKFIGRSLAALLLKGLYRGYCEI